MFVYKHKETIEYVKKLAYFLRKMQILRGNNSYEFLRNFRVLFLYEFKYMGKFSNLFGVPLRKRSVITACSGQV